MPVSNQMLFLDADPGIDDAAAIFLLHHTCPGRLRLLLTSYGNAPVDRTVNNALTLCRLLGWELPVLRGADKPMEGGFLPAGEIHGAGGLAGLGGSFPPEAAFSGDTEARLYQELLSCGEAVYLATGPLTNLARLLRRFPDAAEHIAQAVVMGGSFCGGNVTDTAEFNIYCDPAAAELVFSTLPEIVLVPLDVTSHLGFSREDILAATGEESPAARTMRELLLFNLACCQRFGQEGALMHDAATALFTVSPELFSLKRCGVQVRESGETVLFPGRKNVLTATGCDKDTVLNRIAAAMGG